MVTDPRALNILRPVKHQMSPSDCAWEALSGFRFYQRTSTDVSAVVRDMVLLRDAIADVLDELVRDMRAEGCTWSEVGDALGVSRQGARQHYGGRGIR